MLLFTRKQRLFGLKMHIFDHKLPIKDNYLEADDIGFAAWDFASHEHREEFRDSGKNLEKSAWLLAERLRALKEALADGHLIALGFAGDDPTLKIHTIPENLFLIGNAQIDLHAGTVIGLGREYQEVHICRVGNVRRWHIDNPKSTGRPSRLSMILEALEVLKQEHPGFLELAKTKQNFEIQQKVSDLFPIQFPGNSRIGESTIRRHRRDSPELFV
jgi:hypothetical protein